MAIVMTNVNNACLRNQYIFALNLSSKISFKQQKTIYETSKDEFIASNPSVSVAENTSKVIDSYEQICGRKLNKNYLMFAIGKLFEEKDLLREAKEIYEKNYENSKNNKDELLSARIDLQRIEEKINGTTQDDNSRQ